MMAQGSTSCLPPSGFARSAPADRRSRGGGWSGGRRKALAIALALLVCALTGEARQPDPRQMSGVPLPVSDVPIGTVTVRVLRGGFANPVPSLTVELTGEAGQQRATTNDLGRAEFSGLKPGSRVRAVANLGGERLESQTFEVPAAGGIRLMLVAADPGGQTPPPAGPPAAAAAPGEVVLGEESRFVFEMGEDGLSVFYILQVVNPGSEPVQPPSPVVFVLPAAAKGATVLQGSSPQASVAGDRFQIAGPFAPGATIAQLAYTMPITGPELVVEQPLPVPLRHVAAVAQKMGDMQMQSPQLAEQRTMPAQGNLYIAGRGGALERGAVLTFRFSGLPHHPNWPRNLALGLAALILAGGGWAAARSRIATARDAQRRALDEQRERLFEELVDLDARHGGGGIDPERYAERRRELVMALERIYAALDEDAAVSRAG